jgi:hypothetical protein
MSGANISAGGYQRRVERISHAVVRVRVRSGPPPFDGVRALLLDWLHEKAGRDLSDAMLRGETDSLDLLGAQRVETVALTDPLPGPHGKIFTMSEFRVAPGLPKRCSLRLG